MKAIYLTGDKGKKELVYGEQPKPTPKKGEALIRVKACALNHLDIHMAKGKYDVPVPHILGSDVSGVIEK